MDEKLIVRRMALIMQEMGAIGKNQKNPNLKYNFRGIDDIYNELHSLLAKHEVICLPEVVDMAREERKSSSGGLLITTLLTVRYTFMTIDGSSVTATTLGEAMDSGDKGSNKAMSAASKYALIQAFIIATGEKIDTEFDTPEAVYTGGHAASAEVAPPVAPKKFSFRKPGQSTVVEKKSSFYDVLPLLKIRYNKTFGKFDKYWLQLLENHKVSKVEELTTAEQQSDFLESLENFMTAAEAECKGRKFADLSEEERKQVMSDLEKMMLLA